MYETLNVNGQDFPTNFSMSTIRTPRGYRNVTTCYIFTKYRIFTGTAILHPNEHPDRDTGSRIAFKRAVEALTINSATIGEFDKSADLSYLKLLFKLVKDSFRRARYNQFIKNKKEKKPIRVQNASLVSEKYPIADDMGPLCMDTLDHYTCNRPKGHEGPHVAYGVENPVVLWDN
jgi:hypothetical protein